MNLVKLYSEINAEYYGGCLPSDIKIEWSDDIDPDSVGGSHVHGVTDCRHAFNPPKPCMGSYIRVATRLRDLPRVAGLTLIHETAHVSALMSHNKRAKHGKHFNDEMRRLARLGALDPYW